MVPQPIKKVTTLDSLKKGDTVLITLNGKQVKVISRESVLENEQGENTATGNNLTVVSPNKPCEGETFDGTDRKAAKTSIATTKIVDYNTLDELIATLPLDATMGGLNISTTATSKRVAQENKNVHVKTVWIYTYKRESDEDYHVIIGSSSDKTKAVFFNMEISGLPTSKGKTYAKLDTTRIAFTKHFNIVHCASDYAPEFLDPVPVEITGSLFFDMLHYTGKTKIGHDGMYPKSYWEIYPVTSIKFL